MLVNPVLDSLTTRKNQIAREKIRFREGVPVFSIIEISVVAACNRRCPFCPVSSGTYYKDLGQSGVMKDKQYEKLIADLEDIDYSGMILFSGESEPLLHKKLPTLICETKLKLSSSRIEVNTNGDLLSVDKLKRLFSAGLDTLSVSLYDGPEQIEKFEEMKNQAELSAEQVILRRRYLQDGNYGIHMTNRGGLIETQLFQDLASESEVEAHKNQKFPLDHICYYPFYMLAVDVGGNATICSHDWAKKYVVGNFMETHIFDIWKGLRFNAARKKLGACDRTLPSCKTCNALGGLIGAESFEEWSKTLSD